MTDQEIPATAKIAVLTENRKIEVFERAIPELSDDEALVAVDGCGICGTDVAEYKGDPFGYIPVQLGHEGTGTIVKAGKNVTHDWNGNPIAIGSQIVTGPSFCGRCHACVKTPDSPELCEASAIHGLVPGEAGYFQGWFGRYMVVSNRDAIFDVSGLSVELRLLVEPAAVVVHAVQRAKRITDIAHDTVAVVQGCGPIGLVLITLLRTMGVQRIVAVDGVQERLDLAVQMGASECVNISTSEDPVAKVVQICDGIGAQVVFQCTGSTQGATAAWQYVRKGGALVELGFFANGGDASYNPHLDMCNKQITATGSWTYTAQDWSQACVFLRDASERGFPLETLVTDRFDIDHLNEAMERCISQKGIKVIFDGSL